MPKIYDNIEQHLTKGLNETLEVSQRTDFCVGYFNLRGWKEIANQIDGLPGADVTESNISVHRTCRLLVGMQKMPADILREHFSKDEDDQIDQSEVIKLKRQLAEEFKNQLTIGIPSEADEKALRKLSQQMKDKKVVVKLHLRYSLHAKLYLAYSNDKRVPVVGFLGSSNLTLAGLSKQGELNIDVLEQDAANKLAKWFDDRWRDRWCIDITRELIDIIDQSWATERLISPYYIYLKIAYHLSREARAGINEFKLPARFETTLLDFQQKAVLVAAHHLHNRDGVVIGDVVGLGKTITATALAKMFEEDFFMETLIICPPNLTTMWEEYKIKYALNAKIISIGEVQKTLPTLRRFRLVIIDESHNLRNDQGSRYKAIKSYLTANDSKVILLSATPYNKDYSDLANQLRLFLADDKDLGITPERYIADIGGQVQFTAKHTETFIRSIKAFEKSNFSDDWRELMRLYLVRRTRSFIKNNYATTDPNNGRKFLTFPDGTRSYFPDRIPLRVLYAFNPDDEQDIYARLYSDQIVTIINGLGLPRYGLQQYLNDFPLVAATPAETSIMQNLNRAGRRLMGFCRTNLFKRLESSGYSFLLSLSRHVLRNYLFVYAMQNQLALPIGKNISYNLDEFLEDGDADSETKDDNGLQLIVTEEGYLQKAKALYELFSGDAFKKKFDWIRSDFFRSNLQNDLANDCREILQILEYAKEWKPDNDRQLNALHQLLTQKHQHQKVLVFTQFADTANYLTQQLKKKGITHIESVTGDDDNPTHKAHRFSPISNQKPELKGEHELRVLITTDVLSEGQNLQDAHIILNYDLPWAIIRLIQRAGRVDRIGQKAERILCYSFLPEEGIEQIIHLRKRLSLRIKQNAEVVGSDETFFDGDPINLTDLYNEKSGILDGEEDDDAEVDLASLAYQIWKNATDARPELNKIIPDLPNVLYATKTTKTNNESGSNGSVIVYTQIAEDNDALTWINQDGKIITQSQHAILKAVQCTADTKPQPKLPNHHELVKKGIEVIREEHKNMGSGSSLGKKTSVKNKVYTRLDKYCKQNEGTLLVNDQLKKAVDDIYKYSLKEFAREALNRHLKANINDDQLAQLLVSLREENKLVIQTENEPNNKDPQIICSMGLID
jgi:superfamily II DNA or RNA helicase